MSDNAKNIDNIASIKVVKRPSKINNAKIKVIGVGGGGGNAITHMAQEDIFGVEYMAINTDAQALQNIHKNIKTVLQIGNNGLGAGTNPEIGREAALADRDKIEEFLEDTDMVFITAGMGGGTGTGAAPVIAEIAKEKGILTVGVVTKPFLIEGKARYNTSIEGIEKLKEHVDSIIIIPNEKLYSVLGEDITLVDAFNAINDILLNAVQGIAEIITTTGLVNTDFADVSKVMKNSGLSMMGSGVAENEDRAQRAIESAISSPLLEDSSIENAKSILINITSAGDLTMSEYRIIGEVIKELCPDDSLIVIGTINDPNAAGQIRINIVATGITNEIALSKDTESPFDTYNLNGGSLKQSSRSTGMQPTEGTRLSKESSSKVTAKSEPSDPKSGNSILPPFLQKRST
jgi:cell division protein FtsZ